MKNLFLSVVCLCCTLFASAQNVTMATLLNEMLNRKAVTDFSTQNFKCRKFTSFDRASLNTEDPNQWFANGDASQFLREEQNDGRKEYVIFEAEKPGVVVNFWATFAGYNNDGTLRFYFDGETKPRIEGEAKSILSGGALVGYPLSFSVSELTPMDRRGHNLFLPIPYGKSLKITYTSPTIAVGRDSKERFYYQVTCREYSEGTKVQTYSDNVLKQNRTLVNKVCDALYQRSRGLEDTQLTVKSLNANLNPGAEKKIIINGEGAIRKLSLCLNAKNLNQALRSTLLKISFDGNNTVWVPVGDFFGTGYNIYRSASWYSEVTTDGQLTSYWIMPYRQTCEISLVNMGSQPISVVDASVATSPYRWNKNTMYFGAYWHQETHIQTVKNGRDLPISAKDVNFCTLEGEGIWVGDGITLFNTGERWWGEGDEKIYIDDEKFPSHFGTGTEDYYGYAWCRPEPFDHAFIQQPDGRGNFSKDRELNPINHTVNSRYRVLDAIPFHKSLKFDMEVWHWSTCLMNYAPIAYFYMKPGGKILNCHDEAGIREKVAMNRKDFYPSEITAEGVLKAVDLDIIEKTAGKLNIEMFPPKGPIRDFYLKWDKMNSGDSVVATFNSSTDSMYNVEINYLARSAMPNVRVLLNGKELCMLKSGKNEKVHKEKQILSKVKVQKGQNKIEFVVTACNGMNTFLINDITFKN